MKGIMNRLLASIVGLLPLWAETTIRDTIRQPIAGGLFNGQVVISSPDLTWQGQTYRRHNTTVLVTNGALYLRLIPTIADPDGLSYRVQYVPKGGSAGWVEFWVVPDTVTELKIYQVNRASQPSTGASVGLHQIAGARGNSGRALCSDGTIWSSCDLLVNPAFTPGDLLYRGTAGLEALNIGATAGHVLTVQAGRPAWATLSAGQVTQHQAALAIAWGQLTGLPSTFTPSAHAHASSEIISGLLDLARIPSLPAGQVTSGTFADARITSTAVTQHQAALAITWGQLTGLPSTFAPSAHAHAATEITSGLLALVRIPSLPAGQVTSGTFADARIASTAVTQHQAALAITWLQVTGVPSFEAPLTFGGPLVRSGNSVVCPTCGATGGGGPYTKIFSSSAAVSIPFSDHGYPNDRLIVDCYDGAGDRLEPDSIHVDPTTFAISVYFSPAQAGSCSVVGSAIKGRTISQAFATVSAVLIPNVAEEIGTPLFAWRVYDGTNSLLLADSSLLDGAGNFTVYFSGTPSGRVVLVAQ